MELEHSHHKISTTSSDTQNSADHDDRNDYDDIDDFDSAAVEPAQQEIINEEDTMHIEKVRQRKRSIDALDLHTVRLMNEIANLYTLPRPPSSQMNKLRRSFDQFHRKKSDEMECDKSMQGNEMINSRRHSQVERFRHKFLQYYNEKSVDRKASSLVKRHVTRSWSTSDTEFYALANRYPCLQELETNLTRTSSMNSTCDKEITHLLEKHTKQNHSPGQCTLHDIINNMDIFAITLTREPGKELGLELAHVTQTGSPLDEPSDVLYVYHNRHGNTAIVESPNSITSGAMSPNVLDCENDADDIFGDGSDHNHNHSPRSGTDSEGKSAERTSPGSNKRRSPTGLYGTLDGNELKPSHGVRIVDIAKGSIADQAQKLRKDDVIVEVGISLTLIYIIYHLRMNHEIFEGRGEGGEGGGEGRAIPTLHEFFFASIVVYEILSAFKRIFFCHFGPVQILFRFEGLARIFPNPSSSNIQWSKMIP